MRRTRTIRARCGTVVVETGRLAARRRQRVTRTRAEAVKVVEPIPTRLGLVGELSRMVRGRLAFPRVLFGAKSQAV